MPDAPVAERGRDRAGAAATDHSIKLATWNIHACIGIDRLYDPGRTAAVLRAIDADIACLQEVAGRRRIGRHADQWSYLAEATGRAIIRPVSARAGGAGRHAHRPRIGNAILSRFPVLAARTIDLSLPGLARRSALDADLLVGGRVLRIVATHLGLSALERRLQAARLIAALAEPAPAGRKVADAVLVMGDLNEWRGRAGAIGAFDRCLGPSAAPRTFPSWLPVLALDRIYVDGPAMLRELAVERSALARLASDHLPLVGRLVWSGAERRLPPARRPGDRPRSGAAGTGLAAAPL